MILPDFKSFEVLCRKGNLVPVRMELLADLETPVSAFAKLADWGRAERCFLLESVEGGENVGRYSYLGVDPSVVIQTQGREGLEIDGRGQRRFSIKNDPLDEIESRLAAYKPVSVPGLPDFWGGAVGYMGYDCVRFYEQIPDKNPDTLGFPESLHYITDTLVAFDHVKHSMQVLALAHVLKNTPAGRKAAYADAVKRVRRLAARLRGPLPKPPRPSTSKADKAWTPNVSQAGYESSVRKSLEYIKAGDIFQVEIGRRLSKRVAVDAFSVYRQLRRINPSPYMFYFSDGTRKMVGASPEILLSVEGSHANIRPIAGTRGRGKDHAEDLALERELLADPKERAEHIMMVDLARNDLGRVCKAGTIRPTELMVIERYSHVMHIVSNVEGTLRPGVRPSDVVRASFPAGTMSGAPKIRGMQVIDELETVRRGPYAGSLGWLSFTGNLAHALLIRTLFFTGDRAHAQAAAGIVADSKPRSEFLETERKMRATIKAVEMAEAELQTQNHGVKGKR